MRTTGAREEWINLLKNLKTSKSDVVEMRTPSQNQPSDDSIKRIDEDL